MMFNSSGVRFSRRRLLAGVAVSILRYGGPAWASALSVERNMQKLESVHRLACFRVISAYRTVSRDAACVIACMLPIGLGGGDEDEESFEMRETSGARKAIRVTSTIKWQRDWDNSSKGRWTHRLIPSVSRWVNIGGMEEFTSI
ncbi:uncharacterized protein LOC134207550 [Armigeres subalbatus]|uniref:uncharacterized protein LOC134207550 n=1 Tax=Armigeres subalbatus TaxID=124917 RepID=UPI002ED23981